MKNDITSQSPAAWVWHALYVGKATPASSTSSASIATATESSTATAETPCLTKPASKFVPSQDININRSSLDRLTPTLQVELNYAEQPGNWILQMELALTTPAIVLENIVGVTSASCTESSVLVVFSDFPSIDRALVAWRNSTLLITYFQGCNLETARGFWVTTANTFAANDSSILFTATQRSLTDIATEATLKYGSIDSGVESYTSTTTGAAAEPTAAGPTCAASSTIESSAATTSATSEASATSEPADRPPPKTLDDLAPAAQELYDFSWPISLLTLTVI